MKMTDKRIYDLIMKLGSELTHHDHQWSNELKREFTSVSSYFKQGENNSLPKDRITPT